MSLPPSSLAQDRSPLLSLPYISPSQAQKHVTHNEALRRLDLLVQPTVVSRSLTAPPPSAPQGARWIIPSGATGLWAGRAGQIAAASESGAGAATGWIFFAPQAGWQAFIEDEGQMALFRAGQWQLPASSDLRVNGLGIGTDPDATNRLSVVAAASLFTHNGQANAGHQLKINKSAAAATASLLFQTAWGGRAEMGLTGSDDFQLRVSADGETWHNALSLARATGRPTAPNGLTVNGALSGTAVVQDSTDITAGRVLTTAAGPAQAFRRGNILGTVSQSAGQPTGALIGRGENANGTWVRFADGTQICTHSHFAVPATGSVTWTFPIAFHPSAHPAAPQVCANASGTIAQPFVGAAADISATAASIWAISLPSGAPMAANLTLMALGRWF